MMKTIIRLLAFCLALSGAGISAHAAEVEFQTTMGKIRIQLNAEKAPITVENFLAYVKAGYYDGLIFHRIIPKFVVQGGGFEPGMKRRRAIKGPIQNEANNGLKNEQYSLSMARTNNPNSATSQFFINLRKNESLDFPNNGGYAVFAKVVEGMDVVDKMGEVATGEVGGRYKDVPLEDVVIIKAVILSE